ncbi:protein of unknown function [Taphrina deformans PYCC 5710]|uniref:Autophagy-related protein 27 n=1 Tax=Taphrina deformans (strain PYCC 5710 / ATCC 11124 / CBS 356.35 / IMI 108563 / JCM 9778 / NBRC 8474) TaxID=1097556 RepID=R4XLK7_TAPDE|nr:protein of unknown function [Taphrina deformans PYCC 5710]|eukprot:CCG84175.1 protein of unknown function [Taphrina deformans PYCC 5710]
MRMRTSVLLPFIIHNVQAWTCSSLQLDNEHFDISALQGDHRIESTTETPPTTRHTVYTLNACASIATDKDVNEDDQCPSGTQVCKVISVQKHSEAQTVIEVTPYARQDAQDPVIKEVTSEDVRVEGFKLEIAGTDTAQGNKRAAIIEFICDRAIDIGKPEHFGVDYAGIAKFRWRTKHACASKSDGGSKTPDADRDTPRKATSWGFFTWLFLVVFMAVASFLIFTLFLNYNRYGQVGFDLVPAMDSVKDIPYLFKDFASQVVDTVKGSGSSRSGYSAV